jgi:hypothetical protein
MLHQINADPYKSGLKTHGLALIPSILASDPTWKQKTLDYAKKISKDLPSAHTLETEIECWPQNWNAWKTDYPTSLTSTLQETPFTFYPNIHTMLRVSATLPVSSCECERSFSRMKLLKTYLRSTMGQDRLCGLALLNIHRYIAIDYDKVISSFARAHPRRMELINILND